ncbi:hypothetical protein [Bosea rubneri]|uniref:Uncharacterized protein n=1 Tax=Bosea rubneri TaxID=3075434 RepID=A0ABU3SGL9_9HYPH|nr:hypothetical protein [Bosea sp. ZW T0_25]MDU0343940.1 hypothetical protein [Bosea sp. ZW T0_25]
MTRVAIHDRARSYRRHGRRLRLALRRRPVGHGVIAALDDLVPPLAVSFFLLLTVAIGWILGRISDGACRQAVN